MKSKLSAEEVWEQIERQHDPEKNRVANTYAITLNNGITYLYSVSHDNRLLSIDDWFEGYVCQYGPIESGFPYVVRKCEQHIEIVKVEDKYIQKETIFSILLNTDNSLDILEAFFAKSLRINLFYAYAGEEFACITILKNVLVWNITQKIKYDSYKINAKSSPYDIELIYRFPQCPYKYGIGTRQIVGDDHYALLLVNVITHNYVTLSPDIHRCLQVEAINNAEYLLIYHNKNKKLYSTLHINLDTSSPVVDFVEIDSLYKSQRLGGRYELLHLKKIGNIPDIESSHPYYDMVKDLYVSKKVDKDSVYKFRLKLPLKGKSKFLKEFYKHALTVRDYYKTHGLSHSSMGTYSYRLLRFYADISFEDKDIYSIENENDVHSLSRLSLWDIKTRLNSITLIGNTAKDAFLDLELWFYVPKHKIEQ